MALGIKPIVDFAFKRIFGSADHTLPLLALLQAILAPDQPLTEVEILNPFSYQEFQQDKLIVLDIRARDSAGQWLNIEMQVSVVPGLLQRLVYYACALYVDQLEAGGSYATLRPAISICLLPKILFREVPFAHHRFRLVDREHARELSDAVEVHTLELTKYNLRESTIAHASAIEQWAFFLLCADRYEAARLRELLPGAAFEQAITALESIAAKTEDRAMYDQREKAQRDYRWQLDSAREEGREEGRVKGHEEGRREGREEGREEGVEIGALVGKIQLLQQLVGETCDSTASLAQRPTSVLLTLLADLQQRLRARERDPDSPSS